MFRRALGLISGLLIFSGTVGAANECDSPWIRGVYTGRSPRPVTAIESVAWQQANEVAGHNRDAIVLVGSGRSMQPLYAPGIILVTQRKDYAELQPGQTAIYRNKAGKVVAHILVTKARDGWRATGLNNQTHDMEPVRAENLIGVVIAAFQPMGGGKGALVASTGRR